MATPNKCGLNEMLQAVLSTANSEQNQTYPPNIYSAQYNVVTSLLLSKLVESYPVNQDMLRPFLKTYVHAVKGGYFYLPEEYRNIIGASISAKKDGSGECEDDPPITNKEEATLSILKAGCKSRPIIFYSETEWDYRTTSTYKAPNYLNPIGCFFGKDKFRVCPFDIGQVELRFVVKEDVYRYGYKLQPDDTYIFDPATTIESAWESNAFDPIFTAMSALYAAYTRDPSLMNWAQVLKQQGIL